MSLQIIQGQTGTVDPNLASIDTGWSISGGVAYHVACNAGKIVSSSTLGLVVGNTYVIQYSVSNYTSGQVYPVLGTAPGTARTANGVYTDTIVCTGTAQLAFYSDGNLAVSVLSFYNPATDVVAGTTVVFNEKVDKWTSEYSSVPEQWVKFIDNLFSIKNGQLWLHNSNSVRNNFYGVQYSSSITFYVNINPETVKNFYSMRIQGSSPWGALNQGDIFILPHQGKPNGQQSRLKTGNFRNLQGDFFVDFLRDMTDPRFTDAVDALFNGAPLQGKVLEITITNTDTVTARLVALDISTQPQNYTYLPNS